MDNFSSSRAPCHSCGCRWSCKLIHFGEAQPNNCAARPYYDGADRGIHPRCMDSERRAAALRSRNFISDDRSSSSRQLLCLCLWNIQCLAISRKVLAAVLTDTSRACLICAAVTVDVGIYQLDYLGFRSMKRLLSNRAFQIRRTQAVLARAVERGR